MSGITPPEFNIVDKTSRYQTFNQLSLEKSSFNDPIFLLDNDFNIKTENEIFTVNNVNIEIKR